jgi:hydrogenase-4 membrane subunit HyfE
MKNQFKLAFFLMAVFVMVFPARAHAYLDPGTGSYILQVIAAVLFAGLFLIKTWWTQIRNFISRIFRRKDEKNNKKNPGGK